MRLLSRELLAARQAREAAELLAASLEIENRLGNGEQGSAGAPLTMGSPSRSSVASARRRPRSTRS